MTGQPPHPTYSKELSQQQNLTAERRRRNRVLSAVLAAVLLIIGALIAVPLVRGELAPADRPAGPAGPADPGITVREDSHRLTEVPGSTVTLVEFLDFECEACGAVFPAIEELRAAYGDRVTFVVRYFPVPSHVNAERAARAVEAAAQQGQFEPMYRRMFETQAGWGEQQTPMDARFRGYAQELGLDLEQWDRDYSAPETLERIKADVRDGQTLGVEGTPTFFLNGTKLEPRSVDDLTRALEEALAR
ncbi:DsbA family protein [Microlunatus sp. GCM10028923]|uniref:DsbA family protein n=1 Tax=Microlunatus sp. GCM10028923 TaxID=3273400 RepID=UPI00361B899B